MMQGRFAVISSKCHIYRVPSLKNMHYPSLNNQRHMLYKNMNQLLGDAVPFFFLDGRAEIGKKNTFQLTFHELRILS